MISTLFILCLVQISRIHAYVDDSYKPFFFDVDDVNDMDYARDIDERYDPNRRNLDDYTGEKYGYYEIEKRNKKKRKQKKHRKQKKPSIDEEIKERVRLSSMIGEIKQGCDQYTWCSFYKEYCSNHHTIKTYCRGTCGTCPIATPIPPSTDCKDNIKSCGQIKNYCTSSTYVNYMKTNCEATCGFCTGEALACGVAKHRQVKQLSGIVGGVLAKKGFYPWQAAIYYEDEFLCGGSLISDKLILTAAHCFKYLSTDMSLYKVALGDNDRSKNEGSERTFSVKQIKQHPEYKYESDTNDVAIMELSSKAHFSSDINEICLPQQNEALPVGTTCYMSGWGKMQVDGSSVNRLQELKIPIADLEVCKKRNHFNGHVVNDKMICAGYNNGYNYASGCHGDSGGPLACEQKDGSWKLFGVVSWGSPQCNGLDRYTVFARVSKYIDWINRF